MKKYDKDNTVQIVMKLNKKTDADILKRLSEVSNKQGYIKELIRMDLQYKKYTKTVDDLI